MNPLHRRTWLGGVLIMALTVAAYLPALRGDFIWDDDVYVARNTTLVDAGGLAKMWFHLTITPQYYPLVFTTFWIEHHLWGNQPFGYHLVNVLIHAAGAVLLWRILTRLRVRGACLAAAIFALHPVHVESVAWITERKNVLSGLLYLSSLACYLRFAGLPDETDPAPPRWKPYVLSLLLFCGALLSKSVTASLPAAILLIVWWKRDRIARRDIIPLIPFFILGLAMGLTTAWLERTHVGAEKVHWNLTPIDRVLIAGRALWFYAGKLIWPHPLIFTYPRWQIDSHDPLQYLYPLGAFLLVVALWRLRQRWGRAPLVAALFFGGALLPALGFLNVYPMLFSYVADHFQYLASIGPIALFAALLACKVPIRSTALRATAAAGIVLPLGILTWQQGHDYQDLETLWRNTLAKNDDAWMAHNNLAVLLNRTDRADEAVPHFQRAVELNPNNPAGYIGLVDSRIRQGKVEEAAAALLEARRLDPALSVTQFWMGVIADRRNLPDEAIDHYRSALASDPDLADAHNNLAVLLEQRGEFDSALAHYEKAIEGFTSPADDKKKTLVLFNVAALLENRGRIDEAMEYFRRAILAKPDYGEAHLHLASILFRRHQTNLAAKHYEQAVRHLPGNAQARYNYGVALSTLGRFDEADRQFAEAMKIKPDYVEPRFGQARLLELRGRTDDAIREYESVVRDHPDHAGARRRIAALRGGIPASQPRHDD